MKRYDIEGHDFEIEEDENGYWIAYDDFKELILARIKELEIKLINTNPKRKETVFRRQEVIDELKNLIK